MEKAEVIQLLKDSLRVGVEISQSRDYGTEYAVVRVILYLDDPDTGESTVISSDSQTL